MPNVAPAVSTTMAATDEATKQDLPASDQTAATLRQKLK